MVTAQARGEPNPRGYSQLGTHARAPAARGVPQVDQRAAEGVLGGQPRDGPEARPAVRDRRGVLAEPAARRASLSRPGGHHRRRHANPAAVCSLSRIDPAKPAPCGILRAGSTRGRFAGHAQDLGAMTETRSRGLLALEAAVICLPLTASLRASASAGRLGRILACKRGVPPNLRTGSIFFSPWTIDREDTS